jgi:glycosyltransferase involved in cell wall biosynthesis
MYDTPKLLVNKIDVFENLKDDTILIYSPRWCKNEYNIHIIVKVFVNLRLKFDNIHLCIQSSTLTGTDKDYLNEIMNLICEHNLQSHITIVGLSDFSERLNILNRSNIIVSIPFSDGTPVSVLEAMYLKKIVLCHQIPSTESIIRDNFNGFLVDAKFEDIFTSKLSFIIQNYHTENCFFHIADNAKKFVIDNADLNKEILAYNDSFN